ncbi:MAG: outer membrane protein assembly factor BamD [Planctomycetota bacterium]
MSLRFLSQFCVLVALTLAAATLTPSIADAQESSSWFGGSWFGNRSKPGTAEWWKANKKKAQFEPGKGYTVPGVDGYFDEQGRSINAPVDEVFESFAGSEESGGLIPGLDPKVSYRRAKQAVGMGPNQQTARNALAEGEQLYNQRSYSKAESKFKLAIDRWPKSAVAYRAQFLLGECYFFQDKYVDARDAYDKVVNEQPNTRDLDTLIERQWAIAQYWEKHYFDYKREATLKPNFFDKTRPTLDTVGHAIKTYESIRLNDPTGPRADDAIMATAGIHFRRENFNDADYQYSLLRQEYPRSEHQFEAHILGLQAKLRKYLGPDYDGTPLEEAKVLMKQIRTQFAGRLTDEEKARLRQVQAEVQLAIEKREMRLADYYHNTEQYGAEKQILRYIAADHRGSPIANEAGQRMAALQGEPDEPPTKMAWFVDLFPQNRERTRVAGIQEIANPNGTRVAENPASAPPTGGVVPASATTTR